MALKLVYIPCPQEQAGGIAETLLKEKLVSCCSLFEGKSAYWWKGKIEKAPETIILAKTTDKLAQKVINRVENIHKYEVPCILVLDVENQNQAYLKFVNEVVSG